MKKALLVTVLITITLLASLATAQVGPQWAQSASGGLLSACPKPTAGSVAICSVTNDPANADGYYIISATSSPFRINPGTNVVIPVTTVFGRTGDILAGTNDYKFAQIGGTLDLGGVNMVGTLNIARLPALNFSLFGGSRIAANQLPLVMTCSVTGSLSQTGNTVTLSACN